MATWITAAREIVVLLILLSILPVFFGVTGAWLAIPLSELIVLLTIVYYQMRQRKKTRFNADMTAQYK